MTERKFRLRQAVLGGLAALAMATWAGAGAAADWAEKPYNPPVGSRWIIQRDLSSEEVRREDGRESVVKSVMKITSELTIEAKTAAGYRIAYRRLASSYEGGGENAAAMRAALGALENVVIRASTDAAGKPLRVENLDEVRKSLSAMIERMLAANKDPQAAAVARQMLAGMTRLDPAQAAQANLDEVPALAVSQNTGLKVGETRRDAVAVPNGIGPPMLKKTELTIADADGASGKVRFKLTETYDEDSLRTFLVAIAKATGRDPDDMKQMQMTLDAQTDIEVTDGMTRSIRRQSTTSANLLGNTLVTRDRKDVTVTPAK